MTFINKVADETVDVLFTYALITLAFGKVITEHLNLSDIKSQFSKFL